MKERKSYIRTYVTRVELRRNKFEKLNKAESSDTSIKFELNNEIESLNKEISDIKRSVLSQNANLSKELEELESNRIHHLKKLVYAYGRGSLSSH